METPYTSTESPEEEKVISIILDKSHWHEMNTQRLRDARDAFLPYVKSYAEMLKEDVSRTRALLEAQADLILYVDERESKVSTLSETN